MNYKKLYDQIIERRREHVPSGYTESHHVIPKSLGGDDDSNNVVILTAREHFICHYLLTKMYQPTSREWYKMLHAFCVMNAFDGRERYLNSKLYESQKTNFAKCMSIAQTGNKNSQHGTMWIYNLSCRQSKKIKKTDDIPTGWSRGRVVDFDKFIQREQERKIEKEQKKRNREALRELKRINQLHLLEEKKKANNRERKVFEIEQKEKYVKLFLIFKNGDYPSISSFVRNVRFEYSRQILISNWQKYLDLPTLKWGTKFSSRDAREIKL